MFYLFFQGIVLAPEKYEALLHSVQRDCKVLESFGIMDYSLLLGVHNIDQAIRDKAEVRRLAGGEVWQLRTKSSELCAC